LLDQVQRIRFGDLGFMLGVELGSVLHSLR
jgi:hypothetical protein